MNSVLQPSAAVVDKLALGELARVEGPCLTLLIPDYHPGTPHASHLAVVKALLKNAQDRLTRGPLAFLSEDLLPTTDTLKLKPGGPGFAIFRAPGFTQDFRVHTDTAQLVIGSQPYLRPLIAEAQAHGTTFVLALSTKCVRLFAYDGEACTDVPFPEGVPETLEQAGQFNRSDAHLSQRSGGNGPGGVRFGTTAERKTGDEYLHDFFKTIDHGLDPLTAGHPLILLGVKEEIAAYRRAAKNPERILEGHVGNADFLTHSQIGVEARKVMEAAHERRGLEVLAQYREMKDRDRTQGDVDGVLKAAAEGRVHKLCIREGAVAEGRLPSGLDRASLPSEDQINAAIVWTLRTGGEVFLIAADAMTESMAAILRY